MRVSLLIPVYNCLPFLPRGFDSFVKQTLLDMEVIFVDDASTDGSRQWIEKAISTLENTERVRLIRHERNEGVASARNTLLNNAKGDYVFFVDADDWLELDAMERMLYEAETYGADLVSCDQLLHYSDRTEHVTLPLRETGIANIKSVWQGDLVGGLSHILVRRSLYEKAKVSFIVGADYAEDLQAKVKLFLTTNKYAYVPQAFYHYDQTNALSISHLEHPRKIMGRLTNLKSIIATLEQFPDDFHDLIQKLKAEARYHATRLKFEFNQNDIQLRQLYPECDNWEIIRRYHTARRVRLYMVMEKIGLGCLIHLLAK